MAALGRDPANAARADARSQPRRPAQLRPAYDGACARVPFLLGCLASRLSWETHLRSEARRFTPSGRGWGEGVTMFPYCNAGTPSSHLLQPKLDLSDFGHASWRSRA